MSELKKVFRPELLNRIDEVIVFHKLAKEEIKIDRRPHDAAAARPDGRARGGVSLTEEAKELLVEKGYDPTMGARPLRRAIQRFIEDPLADFVLGRELKPGSTILVDKKRDTEDEVELTIIPGAPPEDSRRSPSRPRSRRTRAATTPKNVRPNSA